MLSSILSSVTDTAVSAQELLICTSASIILGVLATLIFMFRNTYNKSFVVTLALLPTIIQLVIMMVNGNLGTGVAVMGAFSLVRFRSIPGGAREISSIFLAMALGLATGMGYVGVAVVFLIVIGAVTMFLTVIPYGEQREKMLKIVIPEDLDYTNIFDDLFSRYAKRCELLRVKTTEMGSLYELQYKILLKNPEEEKAFIDEIRCRNGNLNIVCSRIASGESL